MESPEEKTVLDWSADCKLLLYSVLSPKTRRDLWMLPLGGTQRTPSLFMGTPFNEDLAQVSPDGHWILYRSAESGQSELYLQPLPLNGQKWQISNTRLADFQWRGDGREILYISGDTMLSVDAPEAGVPFQPHAPKPLFQIAGLGGQNRNRFVVTRDGQRFLFLIPDEARDERLNPIVVIMNWTRLLESQ